MPNLLQVPASGGMGVEGYPDRRGVTFTVVGETSHAEDDDHHHHRTDPESRHGGGAPHVSPLNPFPVLILVDGRGRLVVLGINE